MGSGIKNALLCSNIRLVSKGTALPIRRHRLELSNFPVVIFNLRVLTRHLKATQSMKCTLSMFAGTKVCATYGRDRLLCLIFSEIEFSLY
jgi:hypothetical protein